MYEVYKIIYFLPHILPITTLAHIKNFIWKRGKEGTFSMYIYIYIHLLYVVNKCTLKVFLLNLINIELFFMYNKKKYFLIDILQTTSLLMHLLKNIQIKICLLGNSNSNNINII